MFMIQSCIACCDTRSASSCVVIYIDVLHFAFGGFDFTGTAAAHNISSALGRNSFGTSDGGDYGGTRWTILLRQYPIMANVGPIAESDDM